ncbi:MAG: hypothetical protein DRO05_05555, partial [Thermoproteota archaeon]
RIVLDQAEVFEVDIIAQDEEGEKYCVEVKSGRVGVSDIRQVYANSKILDMKPMLVCKGFADEAAEAVARELDVRVISLSDYYVLLEPEELEIVVRTALQDVFEEYGLFPIPQFEEIGERDWRIIEAIAKAESFDEAAKYLNLEADELGKMVGDLRRRGVFPRRGQSFDDLKRFSLQLIQRYSIVRKLEEIENRLKRIEERLREIEEP